MIEAQWPFHINKRVIVNITAYSPEQTSTAMQLADELDFIFTSTPAASDDYSLIAHPCYLGLYKPKDKTFKPFYIDLLSGSMRYRSTQAGLKKELLARAIGIKPKDNPMIVDATTGLGRDSFILASLGFHITMLERSPIAFALLRDAMHRASTDPHTADIIARMKLVHTDAQTWLTKESTKPQVIYLDPMFPARQKSALVKKEMVILQELIGKDADADQLFDTALTCASKRVVVKRPRLAPNISELAPNFTLTGRSSRFDIYTV